MAMNKSEKAALDRAKTWRALRWSEPESIAPDVPTPQWPAITVGWRVQTYSQLVIKAWSESNSHGDGEWSGDYRNRNAMQGGIALYSTEELAWRALRCVVEWHAAGQLLSIDDQIAKCREGK